MNRATLVCGDALTVLRAQPADTFQCCVTSPPYWGLRDYGVPGQLGLEASPDAYLAAMVAVFAEVRRVLRRDGTLWVNLGDSYTDSGRGDDVGSTLEGSRRNQRESRRTKVRENARTQLAPKNLLMMPARLALALQADGWILRAEIIWEKPNPMPESVQDRPTRAHEFVYLLARSRHYVYDAAAIAEPLALSTYERLGQATFDQQTGGPKDTGGNRSPRRALEHLKAKTRKPAGWSDRTHDTLAHNQPGQGNGRKFDASGRAGDHAGRHPRPPDNVSGNAARNRGEQQGATGDVGRGVPWGPGDEMTRNARSVWTIPTQPYPEAHFATFPEELARRCILAGSRVGDTVLDPFGGSGTVAYVAVGLGRESVYIDVNPAYLALAERRIEPLLVVRA